MTKSWQTKLIHSDAQIPQGYRSLVTPVYRGSTTLFPSASSVNDRWDQARAGYTYGLYGTPTTLELAARICELESGAHTLLTPGGQAAIALIDLSLLGTGDHVLIPASIYKPNRDLSTSLLKRFGVSATFYDPTIGAGIAALIEANTRLVWTESPGSITMEVQDVPAIARAAHDRGVLVALDNTWSAGVLFDALAHGVDVTMQALTKYVGGHSDLLLGSITVRDEALYERLGATRRVLGSAVSPDDCSLALRGLQTLAVRLDFIEDSALAIARWLADRPEVERVLHPALPACPGHDLWKRDFRGSSGVFSIVLKPGPRREQVFAFVDALQLFEIGYSWGGVTSLIVSYDFGHGTGRAAFEHRLLRLSIGLESTADLIADLEQALPALTSPAPTVDVGRPYQERYRVGTAVRVAPREDLENFMRAWNYHHALVPEQLKYAGMLTTVRSVGYYHGGDVLYTLKDTGNFAWLEPCLRQAQGDEAEGSA